MKRKIILLLLLSILIVRNGYAAESVTVVAANNTMVNTRAGITKTFLPITVQTITFSARSATVIIRLYNNTGQKVWEQNVSAGESRTVNVSLTNVISANVSSLYDGVENGYVYLTLQGFTDYDVTPPAAPKSLVLSAGPSQLIARWDRATETDFDKYNIYLDNSKFATTTDNSYVFSGLQSKPYTVSVTAIDKAGNESNKSSAVATPAVSAPGAPALSGNSKEWGVTLTWKKVDGATGYNLYKNSVLVGQYNADYAVIKLEDIKPYDFYVTAINAGGESVKSNTLTLTPLDMPPPPPKLQISFNASYTAINALVTEQIVDDYDQTKVFVGGKEVILTDGKYTLTPIEAGTRYDFVAIAYDKRGNKSDEVTLSLTAPKRSAESDQQPTESGLLVKWSTTVGAAGYIVYLNGKEVARVGSEVTSYTITKQQGYNPTLLTNNASVKPLYTDGSIGNADPVNADKPISMDFIGVKPMLQTALAFLSIYGSWILLVLAVIFVYVFIGPITRWISYTANKSEFSKKRG